MSASQHFEFVSDLARELSSGDISLPSFPDVVVRIRSVLERKDVLIGQVSDVVNTDPVLVSRLLLFANASYYNPAGVRIETLEAAINRLGFELVKNTAVSLAVEQMFLAEKYREITAELREVWQRSMQLAAMATAIAAGRREFKQDTAFLCGLLHGVGKLYILTRAPAYPAFLDDREQLLAVLADWHPKIGRSIVESWKFPQEIVDSMDPSDAVTEFADEAPTLADVMHAGTQLLDHEDDPEDDDGWRPYEQDAAFIRLGIKRAHVVPLYAAYHERLSAVRDALSG